MHAGFQTSLISSAEQAQESGWPRVSTGPHLPRHTCPLGLVWEWPGSCLYRGTPDRASAFRGLLGPPGAGSLEVGLDSSGDPRTQPSAQDKERLTSVMMESHGLDGNAVWPDVLWVLIFWL